MCCVLWVHLGFISQSVDILRSVPHTPCDGSLVDIPTIKGKDWLTNLSLYLIVPGLIDHDKEWGMESVLG